MTVSNPYVIPLSWRNLLLVIGSGLALWVLPWLAWPVSRVSSDREVMRKPTVFRYVKGSKGLDGSAWSPVLMPLPTVDGFSKKAAVNEMPGKSPVSVLKPRVAIPPYLELKGPAISPVVMPAMVSLGGHGLNAEGEIVPVLPATQAVRQEGLHMEVSGVLKDRQFNAPRLKLIPLSATEFPSMALTAYVELDPRGFVQHLLLEQSSGVAAIDAMAVRSLRAGSGTSGAGFASGRIRLYYWKPGVSEKD
jgi:hypothetical protein